MGLDFYGEVQYNICARYKCIGASRMSGAKVIMFISEDEANNRIRSSENLLSRARRDSEDGRAASEPMETPELNIEEVMDVTEGEAEEVSGAIDNGTTQLTDPSGASSADEDSIALSHFLRRATRKMVRGKGLTPEIRAGIGTLAALTSARQAAEMFDSTKLHAFELKRGFHTSADQYGNETLGIEKKAPNQDLLDRIKDNQVKVADVTFQKLLLALDLIDEPKIQKVTDVIKLSHLAGNLSRILSNTTPKEKESGAVVHFHIMRPESAQETDYNTIDINSPRP